VARAEAYLHAKFHLDPSNRLATVHERHRHTERQTDRQTDRQRTDSIGRTVLQTVAQKNHLHSFVAETAEAGLESQTWTGVATRVVVFGFAGIYLRLPLATCSGAQSAMHKYFISLAIKQDLVTDRNRAQYRNSVKIEYSVMHHTAAYV